MSYTDYAGAGGRPVELYHFSCDGQEWYLTSTDTPVTVPAGAVSAINGGLETTFVPSAIVRSAVVMNAEAQTQQVQLTVAPENPIAGLFTGLGARTPVTLTIYGWQRDDPDTDASAFPPLWAGQVKSAQFTDAGVVLACAPYQDVLQHRLLTVLYQPTCNNRVYDRRCGVDQAAHTHLVRVRRVDTSDDGVVIILSPATHAPFDADPAPGRLSGGLVVVGTESQMIIKHDVAAQSITLLRPISQPIMMSPFPDALPEGGGTITVVEGCDKLPTTCASRFDNYARFMGFTALPTRNPFTDGLT